MSVHWPMIRRCFAHATECAFVDDFKTWRRFEVFVAALHLADEFERRCSGDKVGLMLPTSGLFGAAALATWMLGKKLVPLNYLLSRDELDGVVRHAELDFVLSARKLLDHTGHADTLRHANVNVGFAEDLSFKGAPDVRMPAFTSDDEVAVYLYTSGTSGRPKGVMLTHANLKANVRQCIEHAGWTKRSRMLGVLPQFHTFGLTVLTVLPMMVGCPVAYAARFVPSHIVRLIREHKPVAFIGIPSMYNALLRVKNAGPADFRSLEFAISGGEPLPHDVSERFHERFGIRIAEGYGLTETSPVTHVCLPWEYCEGSVGRALPDVEVRIAPTEDDAGVRTHPAGKEGEIRLRGPNIMKGYYKDPEATRDSFDADGFFRTGDIGRIDAEGRLFITGRLKEMMIVGGENVFPREIEEVLAKHPAVKAAGVTGMHDGSRGEVPVAFIELEDDHDFNEQELKAWCRERIANYKAPRVIEVMDELPRSGTNKVLRRKLADIIKEREQADEPAAATA